MPKTFDKRPGQYDDRLAYLARELAQGIRPRADVLASIDMPTEEFADVALSPEFTSLLLREKRKWLETNNARTRTRTKTAALLEFIVEQVSGDITDPSLPLGSRTQLLKVLAGIGGLGEMSGEMATVSTGNSFNLVINYGNGKPEEIITIGEPRPSRGEIIENGPAWVDKSPLPVADNTDTEFEAQDDSEKDGSDNTEEDEDDIDEEDILPNPILNPLLRPKS
jgi:hypothetical protein